MPHDDAEERTRPADAAQRSPTAMPLSVRRRLRRLHRSVLSVGTGERRTPAELTRCAGEVVLLSRFYYVFLAYLVGTGTDPFINAQADGPPTAPLWPIRLMTPLVGTEWLSYEIALTAAGLLFALGAAASPGVFVLRLGAFLHLFAHMAIRNSYGAINHGVHALLLIGFALLFLPRGRHGQPIERGDVRRCLTALWMAQSVVLLSYTLSGFWKLWYGRPELFSSDALTRILLDQLLAKADEIPLLLPFVAQHNWLAQSMWWLALYIELCALLVVFRPHLQRPFGAALMLFHITTQMLMNISFHYNIFMVGVFLLLSPLAPARFSLSATIRSLPIVGIPFRLMKRRQQPRSR